MMFARQNFFLSNFILFATNASLIFCLLLNRKSSFFHEHFIIIYFGSFLIQGLAVAISYFIFKSQEFKTGFLTKEDFLKFFRYSSLAFVANIIFFLVYRVDYWFVKKFCSESDLGNYIQVSKLGQMFFVLPSIISSTIFPVIASGKQEAKTTLKTIAIALFGIYFFLCLLFIAIGKWMFPYLYGSSFEKMYEPFIFSVPGILSLSMLYPFTAYYSGKKRIDVNIKGSLLALVVIIAGDIIFIPNFGIAAAALISSFGYIVYQWYVMFIFSREHKISVASLFYASPVEIKKMYFFVVKYISNSSEND